CSPEVLTIVVKEIEGKQHQPMASLVDGRAQGVEVGDTVLILDDHLAVDQRRLAGELAGSLDEPAIGSGPVAATTRGGSDLSALDDDQGPKSVVLDLWIHPSPDGGSGTSVGFQLDE